MTSHFHFHRPAPVESQQSNLSLGQSRRTPPTLPRLVRNFWPVVYALILVFLLLTFLVELAPAT